MVPGSLHLMISQFHENYFVAFHRRWRDYPSRLLLCFHPLSCHTVKNTLRFSVLAALLSLLAVRPGHAQTGPNQAAPASPAAPAAINPDSVFVNPEVRPQFVGGDKAFAAYVGKSIRYPQQALNRHISGKVYVSFTLSAQGKVQDAHVVSGPGNGLNEEALRLIWTMPAWEPGRVNGQPVRVACTLPIAFNSGR